jgi:hypothetical protein
MADFADRFLRDCKNPDVKNADNEWLGAVHAGPFVIGRIDEVNGSGAEEVPFAPTKHELIQLVKYWTRTAFDIEYWWFLYQQYGSAESRQQSFAWRRINRIASAIGEADVKKAIDEITEELIKENEGWRVFLRGTREEREALQREIERKMRSDEP